MLPPPTTLAIKRPSPDWNVRNADVTALDKLGCNGVVMDPCKGTDTEIVRVQGKELRGKSVNSQLREKTEVKNKG